MRLDDNIGTINLMQREKSKLNLGGEGKELGDGCMSAF